MANFVLIAFLVSSFCFLGSFGDKNFNQIRENAIHQVRYAKVEIETNIYEIVKAAKMKISGDDGKLACVDAAKAKAIEESGTIVAETVGRIMPTIEEVNKAIKAGDASKLTEFFNQWNYPEYKKTEIKTFKDKMSAFLPSVKAQMDTCVA